MAGGDNIEGGKQVVSALHSIPFGNIIGGPLAACVHAQAEASQTTLNFIRGFTMADKVNFNVSIPTFLPSSTKWSFIPASIRFSLTA